MSRTNHDTPSFPRTLRGPRGGRHVAPTPCADCVAFLTCRPGPCSAPFGCDSWVDLDGRRVDPEADDARILAGQPDEARGPDDEDGRPEPDSEPMTSAYSIIDAATRLKKEFEADDPEYAGPLFQR